MVNDGRVVQARAAHGLKKIRYTHFIGYHVLLKRTDTRLIHIAGFELTIGPTVYDPRFCRASAYFAQFINGLDLSGKTIAGVGTGSGLQALAAARAVHRE